MAVAVPHPNVAGAREPGRWADLLRHALANFVEILLDEEVVVDEKDVLGVLDHAEVGDVEPQMVELVGVGVQIVPLGYVNGVLILPS